MEDRLAFSLFGASRNMTVQRGEGGVLQSVLHHANSKTPCYHSCEGLLPIQGSWLTILPWRTQPQIKTKTPFESNFSQPSKQLPIPRRSPFPPQPPARLPDAFYLHCCSLFLCLLADSLSPSMQVSSSKSSPQISCQASRLLVLASRVPSPMSLATWSASRVALSMSNTLKYLLILHFYYLLWAACAWWCRVYHRHLSESTGFRSTLGPFCMDFVLFPPDTLASYHSPKTCMG